MDAKVFRQKGVILPYAASATFPVTRVGGWRAEFPWFLLLTPGNDARPLLHKSVEPTHAKEGGPPFALLLFAKGGQLCAFQIGSIFKIPSPVAYAAQLLQGHSLGWRTRRSATGFACI